MTGQIQSTNDQVKLDAELRADWELLRSGRHQNPHSILGLCDLPTGFKVLRLWRPGASQGQVSAIIKGQLSPLKALGDLVGLFEIEVQNDLKRDEYQVFFSDGRFACDPYTFAPLLTDTDLYLFSRGTHYQLHRKLGARCAFNGGIEGVNFSVWAPNALRVSVIADFNYWNGLTTPMRRLGNSGCWELFVPGIECGERYKFELITPSGELKIKADPFALQGQLRPDTASIVASIDTAGWTDHTWMSQRGKVATASSPFLTYEVHLGSWRKNEDGSSLNYREIAPELAHYVADLGFTHIELLPITEYPFDESWGYQVGGYFAATSRYGTLDDFQFFVNCLHEKNIGILLDWVPGHFVADEHGLSHFDGTTLYEHGDANRQIHPHWGTKVFNHGRCEVSNFLIASALMWLEDWHIDGLRVDAVASMLYLDYGREHREWAPNFYGGRENLETLEFLKHLNSVVRDKVPGIPMIAEESTTWPGVTAPLEHQGLGFHFKWNMGWMNDTLAYFVKDTIYRGYHQRQLTHVMLYAFYEHFALVLSHDEVVHGKGSLLAKMPGDLWQKFANLRLLYTYMLCQPGKKLLFMGGELGAWDEWHCNRPLEWSLLNYPLHRGVQELVKQGNRMYQRYSALWQCEGLNGFSWIDFSDIHNCVISYFRASDTQRVVCIHNFTPSFTPNYRLAIPGVLRMREIFNSDASEYGGSGQGNLSGELQPISGEIFELVMPPLATLVFAVTESLQSKKTHV